MFCKCRFDDPAKLRFQFWLSLKEVELILTTFGTPLLKIVKRHCLLKFKEREKKKRKLVRIADHCFRRRVRDKHRWLRCRSVRERGHLLRPGERLQLLLSAGLHRTQLRHAVLPRGQSMSQRRHLLRRRTMPLSAKLRRSRLFHRQVWCPRLSERRGLRWRSLCLSAGDYRCQLRHRSVLHHDLRGTSRHRLYLNSARIIHLFWIVQLSIFSGSVNEQ